MPNRNGTTRDHALWPGLEFGGQARPDVSGAACMKDCAADVKVTSALPAANRNDHGNLESQNRHVGPQRGIDTAPASNAVAKAPDNEPKCFRRHCA